MGVCRKTPSVQLPVCVRTDLHISSNVGEVDPRFLSEGMEFEFAQTLMVVAGDCGQIEMSQFMSTRHVLPRFLREHLFPLLYCQVAVERVIAELRLL